MDLDLDLDMAANPQAKLLRRFYEPLLVLHALDRTQGEHLPRPSLDAAISQDADAVELRRRYLDALSYACDFRKGGDSTTAAIITMTPLTYHIACNKTPRVKIVPFLENILKRLSDIYGAPGTDEQYWLQLLGDCVEFSARRLKTYREFLENQLEECLEQHIDGPLRASILSVQDQIDEVRRKPYDLCLVCARLMKSDELAIIKARIDRNKRQGFEDRNLADLRHYVGRIAYHVKVVKIMVATARALPGLFEQPEIEVLETPPLRLAPAIRQNIDLSAVATRMFPVADPELKNFQARLTTFDQKFNIKSSIDNKLSSESFNPIIHAELVLLEDLYRRQDELEFFDHDRYIGCSKPACYCCFLYIRNHPGVFVEPASHQKIYVNWMPPTGTEANVGNALIAQHELGMLNKMNVSIRRKLIDQVTQRSGRRGPQHDTVTDDTATNIISRLQRNGRSSNIVDVVEESPIDSPQPSPEYSDSIDDTTLTLNSLDLGAEAQEVRRPGEDVESDIDSDEEGGASLS